MDKTFLYQVFIFLAATSIVVPIIAKFRLGSVLGYLAAGVIIGPYVLGLIEHSEQIMHFAEFGVVMMLFLIGMELEPNTLWKLRKKIIGLGGVQVILTSVALTVIGVMMGYNWRLSLVCGMALALSSTAIVLQMLAEKKMLQTSVGESSFSVLLFQDIAVIPMLVVMPLLVLDPSIVIEDKSIISMLPAWSHAAIVALVIIVIIAGGHYLSRYIFSYIAKANLRDVFTAVSLALVVGVALLMQAIGVSPALGAFVAGVVLANSEYRHTLEVNIEPFKALLLGLFFISVGMGIDFSLLAAKPLEIASALFILVIVKMVILYYLGQFFSLTNGQNVIFAFTLAQGGEFAFVLFQYALNLHIMTPEESGFLTLVVALSMVATPFLMIIADRFITPRFMTLLPEEQYDKIEDENSPVIIVGYGRFGQIIGRFLSAQYIKLTILENDPGQIEMLRKFGNRAYFGDASSVDLLRSAGAGKAKLIVVAVEDADKCLEIVALAKKNFPNLKILARARNRRHAYELHKAGADYFRRETFDSSIMVAKEVVKLLGGEIGDIRRKARKFMLHDEKILKKSFDFMDNEPELISFYRQTSGELEKILRDDIHIEEAPKKA